MFAKRRLFVVMGLRWGFVVIMTDQSIAIDRFDNQAPQSTDASVGGGAVIGRTDAPPAFWAWSVDPKKPLRRLPATAHNTSTTMG